ncbi:uncharacterized protein LOC123298412 [Chrysoperla carnea]|uniref:uncharacterized protein LOC123298412 n=1 Tax=Chrysoperla carnea TaxID=189513 RepID=UPI001D073214|nr:uncharacterized protein LOC123298412 [Chrysoperla carnea]
MSPFRGTSLRGRYSNDNDIPSPRINQREYSEISDTESEDSDVIYIEPPAPPMIDLTTVFTPEVCQRILLMSSEPIDLTESKGPETDRDFDSRRRLPDNNTRNDDNIVTQDIRQRIDLIRRKTIDLTESERPQEDIQIEDNSQYLLRKGRAMLQRALAILSLAQPDVIELSDIDNDDDSSNEDDENANDTESSSSSESPENAIRQVVENAMHQVVEQLKTLDFKKNCHSK